MALVKTANLNGGEAIHSSSLLSPNLWVVKAGHWMHKP